MARVTLSRTQKQPKDKIQRFEKGYPPALAYRSIKWLIKWVGWKKAALCTYLLSSLCRRQDTTLRGSMISSDQAVPMVPNYTPQADSSKPALGSVVHSKEGMQSSACTTKPLLASI